MERSLQSNDIKYYLKTVGQSDDGDIDLAESALMLAAVEETPRSLESYVNHLKRLVGDARDLLEQKGPPPHSLHDCLEAINTTLYSLYEYEGDRESYDDLENANLIRVIDRRRGLPIALGILYIHVGRALGVALEGLNFPGHFLLRATKDGQREIVDPFDHGSLRDTPWLRQTLKTFMGKESELKSDYCRPVGNRHILLRLQNNIKIRLIEAEDPERALTILKHMLTIAPKEPALWREAGTLQAYLNNIMAAIASLERYLMLEEDPRGHPEAVTLLRQLKSQLN